MRECIRKGFLTGGDFLAKNKRIDMDQLTDPAYYIMLSVIEARHGYAIMKYIEELTNGEFPMGPATLYTLTKKLQQAEMIELLEDKNDRRKTYKATELGSKLLENEIERRSKMVAHGRQALYLTEEGAGKDEKAKK